MSSTSFTAMTSTTAETQSSISFTSLTAMTSTTAHRQEEWRDMENAFANSFFAEPPAPDAPEEALAPDAHPQLLVDQFFNAAGGSAPLCEDEGLNVAPHFDRAQHFEHDGNATLDGHHATLLGYTETPAAPYESFVAPEPQVLPLDSPANDAHGASQDVVEPPAVEEVDDAPPPGDNTEGTQLAMALVATQPEVAVLRGVVPTELPKRAPPPTKCRRSAQVPKPKPEPTRTHACGESGCFKSCASASALAQYMRTHALCTCVDGCTPADGCKKHPFPCATCGIGCSKKINLKQHIDEVHLLKKYL